MIKNQYHRELSMFQSSCGARTIDTNIVGIYRSVDQYTVIPRYSSPAGSFTTKDIKIPRKQMQTQCDCRDIIKSHDRELSTPTNKRVVSRGLYGKCNTNNEKIRYNDKGL